MDRDGAKADLKTRLEEELQSRGINTRKPFRCLNPAHEDKHPSMSYDAKSLKARCFSCQAAYDTIDIIGLDHGWTDEGGIDPKRFTEALAEGCRKYGIQLDDRPFTPSGNGKVLVRPAPPEDAPKDTEGSNEVEKAQRLKAQADEARANLEGSEAIGYLKGRGISEQTARAYGLGYLPRFFAGNGKQWHALIIPTGNGHTFTARNLHPEGDKDRYQNRGSSEPFNLSAIYEAEAVHIVEGEIDALSVIEAGGQAIALGSTSNTGKLLEELRRCAESDSKPLKCNTLILSLDNDEAGLRAAYTLREGIHGLQSNHNLKARLKEIDIAKGRKDPNAYLIEDPEGFRRAVSQRASDAEIEAYANTNAGARLMDFYEGVAASADTPATPTGFSVLDAELEGGLYEGFYIIAAITSLGKTALALQMADNIANGGRDVLYITLEMAESELIARSLSRHTFTLAAEQGLERGNAKSVRGITDGKRYERYSEAENALILEAYNAYSRYADRLYIREGLGNITVEEVRRMVQRHIDLTGRTPVVFVDYAQILAPSDVRATDKQNMDQAALGLKRISRDFKTPVIAISSLNRDNYKEAINLAALKESGALEYSSDVVIGLQLQGAGSKEAQVRHWVDDQMKKDPRAVEARILKNRNGRRGGVIQFEYYPVFNLFKEAGGLAAKVERMERVRI